MFAYVFVCSKLVAMQAGDMNEFNIEHQYQLYLKRMALEERRMHPEQRKQLRETFFGACGQMLILLRDELSKLEDDKAVETMQDMINQVAEYFLSITGKKN